MNKALRRLILAGYSAMNMLISIQYFHPLSIYPCELSSNHTSACELSPLSIGSHKALLNQDFANSIITNLFLYSWFLQQTWSGIDRLETLSPVYIQE